MQGLDHILRVAVVALLAAPAPAAARPAPNPPAALTTSPAAALGAAALSPAIPPDTAPASEPDSVEQARDRRADSVAASSLSVVSGRVHEVDQGEPVAAASVILRMVGMDAPGRRAQTNEEGRFLFTSVPSGEYTIRTHHIGFQDRTDTLEVGVRSNVAVVVSMAAEAVELPPIDVTVRAGWLVERGFYSRRAKGSGVFLTPEQVDRRNASFFTDLLKPLPGVNIVRACGASYPCDRFIRMSLTNHYRNCRVTYYMDGSEMHGRVYPDDITALDIAAVEVYRSISETPPEYYGRCGSVVMWSKRE